MEQSTTGPTGFNKQYTQTGYSFTVRFPPEPEPKQCPFCGSNNLSSYYKEADSRGVPFHPTIRCNACKVILRFNDYINDDRQYLTLEDLIKVWNRRVKE